MEEEKEEEDDEEEKSHLSQSPLAALLGVSNEYRRNISIFFRTTNSAKGGALPRKEGGAGVPPPQNPKSV